MKVLKIFLKLKLKEIWQNFLILLSAIGLSAICVLVLVATSYCLGRIVCHFKIFNGKNVWDAGFACIAAIIFCSAIIYFIGLGIKTFVQWIASNWHEAKYLASKEQNA